MSTEIEQTVERAVKSTLLALGISTDDPLESQREFAAMRSAIKTFADPEFQKDMAAIRTWRNDQEKVKQAGIGAVLVMCVSVFGFLLWWGFKTALSMPMKPPIQ